MRKGVFENRGALSRSALAILAFFVFGEVSCHCHGMMEVLEGVSHLQTGSSACCCNPNKPSRTSETPRPAPECHCSGVCCDVFLPRNADDDGGDLRPALDEYTSAPLLICPVPDPVLPERGGTGVFATDSLLPHLEDLTTRFQSFLL